MKNIYDGTVRLGADGRAQVVLPAWFEALNEDFRYQLTSVDGPAPALHVAARLRDGRFSIGGGTPGGVVCWQVTGVRHDAFALANPLAVELDKTDGEVGRFLHPEPLGMPHQRPLAEII